MPRFQVFSEDYIRNLPQENALALFSIAKTFKNVLKKVPNGTSPDNVARDTYIFLKHFFANRDVEFSLPNIDLERGDVYSRVAELISGLESYGAELDALNDISTSDTDYGIIFGQVFCYEFADDDINHIQELINQLRDLLSETTELEDRHRQRLLRRLERLQSELHKKMSDLDRFWGLIGDGSVVAQKTGTAMTPYLKILKDLMAIVWKTQSVAEGLPSDMAFPSIPFDDSNDDSTT